ncbi:hypothetical protein METBIDRAFT_224779 [Metschnikowia bicuspidata var. bicuspidata NRRL YB-4993]|nr:hypothetical protein METBIDRAFT_224779 [Metschnikowia bicuspidata var. bicuspidata NRRL YB-4993]OBA19052.1 hypothetical protein METBIDRAFT_224779 [Metschnikowia bicuspidata var. bicuspidata NRRL YB-4993]
MEQQAWVHSVFSREVSVCQLLGPSSPMLVFQCQATRPSSKEFLKKEKQTTCKKKTKGSTFIRREKVKKEKRQRRSKQGCWTCRLRHKACPEDGDPCGACARLGLECDVSRQRPSYMVDAQNAMHRLKEIRAVTDKLRKNRFYN